MKWVGTFPAFLPNTIAILFASFLKCRVKLEHAQDDRVVPIDLSPQRLNTGRPRVRPAFTR